MAKFLWLIDYDLSPTQYSSGSDQEDIFTKKINAMNEYLEICGFPQFEKRLRFV